MIDNIREWISDNLRYILLGVAGILILLVAFLAIRLVSGLGSKPDKAKNQTESQSEQETMPESEAANDLVRNQQDVLNVVTNYYNARLNKDFDTLGEICETMNDDIRAQYERQDASIEAYNNIMTYSKAGLDADSYIVFAYFDVKLTGYTTLVPTLRGLYLMKNESGNLIVVDPDNHQDIKTYQEQVWADDDVQALLDDVTKQYNDTLAQDPDLAAFVGSIQDPQSGGDNPDAGTDGNADGSGTTAPITGTMYSSTELNVRGTPSIDGTMYGVLMPGTAVEVLENMDVGWSKIRYTVNGTTIEGYVKTEYLTTQQ